MSRRASPALLSMVVPCFDEEAVISEMHRRLVASLEGVPDLDFEIVYVDDGSRDATLDHLRGLQEADPGVRVLSLPRNFGHQIVLTAGLAEASAGGGGDAIVTIDADLQDPPEIIPKMLERWRQSVDVVYGVRSDRAGEPANLPAQPSVAAHPRRRALRFHFTRLVRGVCRWGYRHLRAQRPDPVSTSISVDEHHHHLARRSSSAWANGGVVVCRR